MAFWKSDLPFWNCSTILENVLPFWKMLLTSNSEQFLYVYCMQYAVTAFSHLSMTRQVFLLHTALFCFYRTHSLNHYNRKVTVSTQAGWVCCWYLHQPCQWVYIAGIRHGGQARSLLVVCEECVVHYTGAMVKQVFKK